jgi:hypothetical protein
MGCSPGGVTSGFIVSGGGRYLLYCSEFSYLDGLRGYELLQRHITETYFASIVVCRDHELLN